VTARDGRGGSRVPDGIPRPAAIPFAQGPNRSDLSALPGTPGTPLPGNDPIAGSVAHGSAGGIRRALSQIPLDKLNPGSQFGQPTTAPNEPVTSGIDRGAGLGPEGLIPSPDQLSNKLAASEIKGWYPILMRLATLPNTSTQTKIMAQRLRSQLGIKPHQIPKFPGEM